jgi:hypothetical protein
LLNWARRHLGGIPFKDTSKSFKILQGGLKDFTVFTPSRGIHPSMGLEES